MTVPEDARTRLLVLDTVADSYTSGAVRQIGHKVAVANKLAHSDAFAFSQSRGSDGTVRLAVSGEVDIYAAPRLREAIQRTLADPCTTDLMVDFAHVDYIDCAGVSVLIAGRRLAEQQGIRFAVVNAHDQVLRVFTVLCLDHVLVPDMQHSA